MVFILFLFASWLAGSMMNFQFRPGEGADWDIGLAGPLLAIILFGMPVFIFWRARTRIFFIIFSAGLFFLVTPFFFDALRALVVGLTVTGIVMVFIAFKKGYISKKKAGLLIGATVGSGGGLFFWFMIAETGRRDGFMSGVLEDTGSLFGGTGFLMLILISIFAVGFFLYQKYEIFELFDFGDKEKDKKEIERDISSTVDKAIQDLIKGKDIRATIMECYNQMSLILEKRGIRDEKHMTPREFENTAIENLDVETSKISQIREIFELAKYSSHKLTEKDKERVIEDLEALRDDLG